MDIDFNQSEAQMTLCSRIVLCNSTNIKCSPLSTKRKGPGFEGDQISVPPFINHVKSITILNYIDILLITIVY